MRSVRDQTSACDLFLSTRESLSQTCLFSFLGHIRATAKMRSVILWLVAGHSVLALAIPKCGPCDSDQCQPPSRCLAGMVKDACGCCYVCGRREGELCGGEFGSCGEHLECRLRNDLPPDDPPEALCVCTRTEALCGSDGVTYDNECQLMEARYEKRDGLYAISRGPCDTAPKIVSPPEDVRNTTGSSVALSCEVSGWPVPNVEWKVERLGDQAAADLPSDDPHIVIQTRGGPSDYEATSWLQIVKLTHLDAGNYRCVAKNRFGQAWASATVFVKGSYGPSVERRDDLRENFV